MSTQLQKLILFTVAYFSAFDYPLTSFELWRHLIDRAELKTSVSYLELLRTLKHKPLVFKLARKNGFITLKNEVHLIDEHLAKHKLSLGNIKVLKRWAKAFLWLPYIRGIFLTGTLSMKNASAKSDWDILLVFAKKRIWIGRLLVSGTLHLLGKRRHGNKVERRFCLNHYLTENGLILDEHNEFCANFVTFSAPVFGEEEHRKYLSLNESWIRKFNPCYSKDEVLNDTLLIRSSTLSHIRQTLEKIIEFSGIGALVNKITKKFMIEKIEKNPATHTKNADIRYSDVALVFLPSPHRIKMIKKTGEKLTKGI